MCSQSEEQIKYNVCAETDFSLRWIWSQKSQSSEICIHLPFSLEHEKQKPLIQVLHTVWSCIKNTC